MVIRSIHNLKKNIIILLLFYFLAPSALFASERYILPYGLKHDILNSYIEYLEDKESKYDLNAVLSPAHSCRFASVKKNEPNFGLTNSAYWFRFTIENTNTTPVDYYIEADFPRLNSVSMYIPGKDGYKVIQNGINSQIERMPVQYQNFAYLVKQYPGKNTYYVRIKTEYELYVPVKIWSINEFLNKVKSDHAAQGLYYGMFFLMLIYNLFIFFSVKESIYLYYITYLLAFIAVSLSLDGLGQLYIWSNNAFFTDTKPFTIISTFLSVLFTREFLDIKKVSPVMNKLLLFNAIAGLVLFAVYYIVPYQLNIHLYYTFLTIILTLASGFIAKYNKVRSSTFFLFSWAFIILGTLAFALRSFGILQFSYITDFTIKSCGTIQFIMLSFGLADKITLMKRQLEILNQDLLNEAIEQTQVRIELADEKERLLVTLRSIAEAVIVLDVAKRIVLMNNVAEELTGWPQSEVTGKHIDSAMNIIPGKSTKYKNIISSNDFIEKTDGVHRNAILVSRYGKERIISGSASSILNKEQTAGYVLVLRDITEQIKIQEEITKVEKLESIGILAGGIAHDFNNYLTAIIGNLSIAKRFIGANNHVLNFIEETEKASLRAQSLTRQLLTFSKGGSPVKQTASLEELIIDSAQFVLRGSNVKCYFNIKKDLHPVDVDINQFSNVIQNIVINAEQAMRNGGEIEISADNIVIKEKDGIPLLPGKYVKISLADNGPGITAEAIDKIFDPFFTTKKNGSGLGLSTVYSIIKKHEGFIIAENKSPNGALFTIYLPISVDNRINIKRHDNISCITCGRVLIMDDDKNVSNVLKKMLEIFGCEVDTAVNGQEAIDLYKNAHEKNNPYNFIILDLTIPGGIGGKEVIIELKKLYPEIKAFVSSGYSNDAIISEYYDHGFIGVIPKPYRIEDVREVLNNVLIQNTII